MIETFSAGYETVNRRLWLLLFPIGLDLLLWLGPRLSVVPLAGYLPWHSLEADQAALATEVLAQVNLAVLLALYVPTLFGRLTPVPATPDVSHLWSRPVVALPPGGVVVALCVLLPLSLLIAALYLGLIGELVQPAPRAGGRLRAAARNWWRLIVLHAAAAALFLGIGAPAGLAIWGASHLSVEAGAFLLLLTQLALVWLVFYLFFALAAVILSDAGPLRAALTSVEVVRANFWPAVAFIGLSLVIDTGLPIVWRALAGQLWGLMAGMVGNAYVGTGLAAASMLFYRDRQRLLATAGA